MQRIGLAKYTNEMFLNKLFFSSILGLLVKYFLIFNLNYSAEL